MKKLLLCLCLLITVTSMFADPIVSCGPTKTITKRATLQSIKSGNWTDPLTWGGALPTSNDLILINVGHIVTVSSNVVIAGAIINGILLFDNDNTATVTSTKNIIVNGEIFAKPNTASIIHTIKFTGINEANFVGGGMDPLDSDVGLWVMGNGRLTLEGNYKTPFTNAVGGVNSGSTTVKLKDHIYGWNVGDQLTIAPTSNGSRVFEERVLQAINTIMLTSNPPIEEQSIVVSALSQSHPIVNDLWTAEVMNLTRNVKIEGTATGRAHVFIRSMMPQSIKNVEFRYVGPRKANGGISALVVGRYGIHFHHCMSGSVGTIVDGCVIRDAGNHAYVPHVSDGITMSNNIAYNIMESLFWWDLKDVSNNTKWLHNIVAGPTFTQGSLNHDTEGSPTFGVHGFVIGLGDGNIANDNIVVGQVGLESVNAAYAWEEQLVESVWEFKNNIAHNCDNGLRSWQNNSKNHVIENTTIYNCNIGISHGAYGNNYTYLGGYLYNAKWEHHAASSANGVKIINYILDGAGIVDYPFYVVETGQLVGARPVQLRNVTIKGGTDGAILNESNTKLKNFDLVGCSVTGSIRITGSIGEVIRIQPLVGQSLKVTKSAVTNIAPFAPYLWGTGSGLKVAYYNNTDFTNLAIEKIEPIILFEEWVALYKLPGYPTGVHYKVLDETYSARYTGYIEPQYNETYTFKAATGGGVRVYVNNVLIINKWTDPYPTTYTSSTIALQAGRKYPIKVEYFTADDKSNLSLYWKSASLKEEIVPQSQLYVDTTYTPPPPPPVNQLPTVSAGSDGSMELVINLAGTASDSDGTIASYLWEKISGPTCTILSPASLTTQVKDLNIGTYKFRLTVVDDKGGSSNSEVTYIIK